MKDINRRQKLYYNSPALIPFSFGENERTLPSIRSYWYILLEQFKDGLTQLLLAFAAAQLVLALFSDEKYMWLKSVSVAIAVFFAALIASLCDYGKQKQFLNLQKEILNERCTVIRGQYGTSQDILVSEIVVGDVLILEAGDRVPADCVLV